MPGSDGGTVGQPPIVSEMYYLHIRVYSSQGRGIRLQYHILRVAITPCVSLEREIYNEQELDEQEGKRNKEGKRR